MKLSLIRTIGFFACGFVGLFASVQSAQAWEYDSGWINLSGNSDTSRCVYSHHMPWVRACSVVEGPQGNSNAQWFTSDIKLPNYSFSEGNCQVQTRSAYSGTKQTNEDFRLTINGRTVVVRDQGNSSSNDEVRTVTIPGQFTFYDNWNRLYFAGDSSRGWSGSVWFGDYHVNNWGSDVLEAPGIRAIRVQCNDASPQPVCGNGTVETGEQCDDGNRNDSDQCSNSCRTQTPPTGPICGNGTVETGEQCDDGNRNDSDQCSNSCTLNRAQCGNGRVESWGGEQCDDGNGDYTDGCVAYCKSATCGDGYVRSGVEQCDDGNTRNGDGCSSACQIENIGATCGGASTKASCSAPSSNLCRSGVPGNVTYDATSRRWTWTCSGSGDAKVCTTRKRCGYIEINP